MKAKRAVVRAVTLAYLGLGAGAAFGGDFHVQQSVGDDANAGDGWGAGHALATIQRALDLAAANPGADTVRVASATYTERLRVGSDVTLLGGYPVAGGPHRHGRRHPTVVDGGGSGTTIIIDGVANVVVDGFVVRHGNNQAAGAAVGGGIAVTGAHGVTLRGNQIEDNQALDPDGQSGRGGGIGVGASEGVTIARNILMRNQSQAGGGLALLDHSVASVVDNRVVQNRSVYWYGGGVYAAGAALELRGNRVLANQAHGGGGVALEQCVSAALDGNLLAVNRADFDGGGLLVVDCEAAIVGNAVRFNHAGNWGGGINLREGAQAHIHNNLVSGNRADANGGGISLYDRAAASLVNNTVARNRADNGWGGGLYLHPDTQAAVVNTLLWVNGSGEGCENGNAQVCALGTAEVTYSDVQGGWAGTGNIDQDPQWLGPFDYHLRADSPCIDAGSADGAPATDLDGIPRPIGSGVDIGAYEWVLRLDLL